MENMYVATKMLRHLKNIRQDNSHLIIIINMYLIINLTIFTGFTICSTNTAIYSEQTERKQVHSLFFASGDIDMF